MYYNEQYTFCLVATCRTSRNDQVFAIQVVIGVKSLSRSNFTISLSSREPGGWRPKVSSWTTRVVKFEKMKARTYRITKWAKDG